MSNQKELDRLCDVFGGKATRSEYRFYIKNRVAPTDYLTQPLVDFKTDVVGATAIHIPDHMLDDFLRMFDERKYQEMEIRLGNSAVKKAYENYRLLLNLCKGDYNAGY